MPLLSTPVVTVRTERRTLEFKLYPTAAQAETLTTWLRRCCWVYNRCLEHRVKAYKRREESVSFYDQCALVSQWRRRIGSLRDVPGYFLRDAARRVDRGFRAFFCRVQAGEKPGFPRFRSWRRYQSMDYLCPDTYTNGTSIWVPKLGWIKARGPWELIEGKQKLLRVICRAHGWYAQVVIERQVAALAEIGDSVCGVDLGLNALVALDNGERFGNPRILRRASRQIHAAAKQLSRRQKGSRRREKARQQLARIHEQAARQRKGFCHRFSRELVNRFDGIAYENLNIKGMVRGWFAKSILDAAWGFLLFCIIYKAASAGKVTCKTEARQSSQECPDCGNIVKKELSERIHACKVCHLVLDRDVAAARVIRQRAFGRVRGDPIRPGVQAGQDL